MPDKYDRAIAYLTEFPAGIGGAWGVLAGRGAPLFQFVTPTGEYASRPGDERECGCLTTIKGHGFAAWTDELEAAIRADDRIPESGSAVTLSDLPVFAEWQRRIDRELGRATEEAT